MPVLKDFRETRVLELPSFPGSKVEVYDSLLVGEVALLGDLNGKNELQVAIAMLPRIIKSWNFTDENGKDMEINAENIAFFKQEDLIYCLNEIKAFAKENKKKDETTQQSASD